MDNYKKTYDVKQLVKYEKNANGVCLKTYVETNNNKIYLRIYDDDSMCSSIYLYDLTEEMRNQ